MTAPFVFGFIAFAFWHEQDRRIKTRLVNDTTICLIEEVYGSDMRVSYQVNGQTIIKRSVDHPYIGITQGERFKTIYHQEYIDQPYFLYHLPVFDTAAFLITKGVLIKAGSTLWGFYDADWIRFEYSVNGKIYKRVQEIFAGHHFTEGQKIKVYYHPQNPRMGYLVIP